MGLRSSKNVGWGTGIVVVGWILVKAFLMMGSQEADELVKSGNQLIAALETSNQAAKSLGELLENVIDVPSALDATPKLKKAFTHFRDSTRTSVVLEKRVVDMGNVRVNNSQSQKIDEINRRAEALGQEGMRIGARAAQEIERINNFVGLPIEFWEVFSPEVSQGVLFLEEIQTEQVGSVSEMDRELHKKYLTLIEKHGFRKTTSINFEKLSKQQLNNTIAAFSEKYGETVEIEHWYDSSLREAIVLIAPVEDLEELATTVPKLHDTWYDAGRRNVVVGVEAPSSMNAIGVASVSKDGAPTADVSNHVIPEEKLLEEHRKIVENTNPPPEFFQSIPTTPQEAQAMAKQMEQLAKSGIKIQPSENDLPRKDDPEYLAKLSEMLIEEGSWSSREEVIDQLLKVDRKKIEDKELVKEIARNFRRLAYRQDASFKQEKIIRGLVKYAGKYSVPVLIDILNNESLKVDNEVFFALGEYPSRDTADAVAKYLGDFFNHQQAVSCLRRMGSAAEPTLIDVAPTSNPQISLAAVELLGEVGTEKCLPLLRKGMKSRNPQVRQASKVSLRKVKQRGEASK